MRTSPTISFGAAADAWAAGDVGGIGGWWQTSTSESPTSFGWLSLHFRRSEFPEDFNLSEDLHNCIASLALMAHRALLQCR